MAQNTTSAMSGVGSPGKSSSVSNSNKSGNSQLGIGRDVFEKAHNLLLVSFERPVALRSMYLRF